MPTDARDRRLRRTTRMMRAWRALALMGWLFFLCSLAYLALFGRPHHARAIKVNDEIVLWVRDEGAAERVLTKVLEGKGGAHFDATVVHESAPLPKGAKMTSEREAIDRLAERLPILQTGWKIVVGGKDIVTMDSHEDAEKVLEELKSRYAALKEGEKILAQKLEPEPVIRETTVRPGELHTDVQSAAEMLQSSQPETVTHVVQQGDTPYSIAGKFGIRLRDLVAQNPTLKQVIDGERYLLPGEKLNVKKQRKGVKVITVKQYEEERTVELDPVIVRSNELPQGQERVIREGRARRQKVTVTVTLENDREVRRKEDPIAPALDEGEQPKKMIGTGPPRTSRR
jgi:LysM repeat protein